MLVSYMPLGLPFSPRLLSASLASFTDLTTLTVTAKRPRIAGIFENGPSGRRVSDLVFLSFVTEVKTLARRQNARRAREKRVENA
jgi:hypothetical protein